MRKFIIGIDVGREGAISLLSLEDNKYILFEPLPYNDKELDLFGLKTLLMNFKKAAESADGQIIKAFLEKAQPMPKQAVSGAFRYARGAGIIEASLFYLEIPYTDIRPHVWTKELHQGISGNLDSKAKSKIICQRLFPTLDLRKTDRCRNAHEGFIDAILIAEYGRRKLNGEISSEK